MNQKEHPTHPYRWKAESSSTVCCHLMQHTDEPTAACKKVMRLIMILIDIYRQQSVVNSQSSIEISSTAFNDLRDEDSAVSRDMLVVDATSNAEAQPCIASEQRVIKGQRILSDSQP